MAAPLVASGLTLLALVISGTLAIATFRHAPEVAASIAVTVPCWIAAGFIPPLLLKHLPINGAAMQLGVVAWRMPIMLAALGSAGFWESEARICFLQALLACYFVSLPLESWLLIRSLGRSIRAPSDF